MNNRIKQIRKINNLTQWDFAERIGISRVGLQKLENGDNSPREQTIRVICSEFNVNRIWLETGAGAMEAEKAPFLADEVRSILRGSYTDEQIAMVVSILKMPPEFFEAWVAAFDSEMSAIKKGRD
jgi:transcriptional regulator with XRE-family HTH domain